MSPTRRLLREEAESLSRLNTAQAEIMAAGLDLPRMLHTIASSAMELTGADGAVVEIAEGSDMVSKSAVGSAETNLGIRVPVEGSLSGLCYTTNKTVICDDSEVDARVNRDACRKAGARSLVAVPLNHKESPLGVLKIISGQKRAFGPAVVDLMELLARSFSGALASARLFQMQKMEAEERSAELESLRQRFEVFMHHMPVLAYIKDFDGRYVYVNPAMREAMALRGVSDPLGVRAEDWMPSEVALEIQKQDREILESQEAFQSSGTMYVELPPSHFMLLRFPIEEQDGRRFLGGISVDVSERIEAENDLRSSEELFRLVTRATSDGVWDWNMITNDIWVSETVLQMFGYSGLPQIISPDWWRERMHSDDRSILLATVSHAIESGSDQWSGEYRFRTADGTYAHLHDRAYIMREADGTPRRMVGALQDVTARKKSEEEIRRLNRLNELVLNAAGNSIAAVDRRGNEIMANPKSASMTQYPLDFSAGRFRHELVHHSHADGTPYAWEECPVYKTLGDGKVRHVLDEVFWRRDGTSFPVEYSVTPIVENLQVSAAVEVAEDVTARKKIESQLEQSRRLSAIGKLAATVAHEFNNVLMGIQPFAELIERRSADTDLAALSHRIVESVRRGKKITQEILRFTQPSQPEIQSIAVGDWLQRFKDESSRIAGKSVSITVTSENNLRVAADPVHLHQVFSNLTFNACDAMPDGGAITIQAQKGTSDLFPPGLVNDPDRFVHFRFTDTGRGIPATALPFIFDPLFTTKKSGTGLGLAVSYQIIGHHGGQMLVDSTEGEGTTFHILLPEGDEVAISGGELPESSARRPRRILLVEDDPSVAEGLTSLLELEGMAVQTTGRGSEVQDAIEKVRPELIVLDIGLPDMSGYAVYEQLAISHPEIPVIFSSGHGDEARLEKYRKEHGVAFLLKPYDAAALISLMEQLLGDGSSDPRSAR